MPRTTAMCASRSVDEFMQEHSIPLIRSRVAGLFCQSHHGPAMGLDGSARGWRQYVADDDHDSVSSSCLAIRASG